MKEKNKLNLIISVVIFLAVITVLVFITINKKENMLETSKIGSVQQLEGVKITILQEGNGEVAKVGDVLSMNYTGKLADGTVFDSNIDPNFGHVEPFAFVLGGNQVIKGWEVGTEGMKVGEKRMLEISPEYAYGSTGAGNIIPPNSTISFEVELLKIGQ